MGNPDGTPIWYELLTTDAAAAERFYADVVGWSIAPFDPSATGGYRILTAPDGQPVGGLMTLPQGAPMSSGWHAYLATQDVDGTAGEITRSGGSVLMAPHDLPGVGRFAFVADPQGLNFYVMRGDGDRNSAAFAETAPGHCGWNELVTSDQEAALDFYGGLFGWENNESMPMGEMGQYRFLDHAGRRIGAMVTAGPGQPTRWTCYFNVPSIAAAVERIAAGGGTVTMGPDEVPGGMHIVMATDPQGAAFALVGGA